MHLVINEFVMKKSSLYSCKKAVANIIIIILIIIVIIIIYSI